MDLNFKIVTKLEQIYPKNEIDEIMNHCMMI